MTKASFWNTSAGQVLRWVGVVPAAFVGLGVGQVLGAINAFLVSGVLPVPDSWQPALSHVLAFYFGPLLFVAAPSVVAPKGTRIVSIVSAGLLALFFVLGLALFVTGATTPIYKGFTGVLFYVLGALGLFNGLVAGFSLAENRAEANQAG